MDFIDTHCHIQSAGVKKGERATRELWAKLPNASGSQLVENATNAGVRAMLCVGCDLEDSKLAIEFARHHPECYPTIGIHPHEAKDYADNNEKLQKFAALANEPSVIAVGECGLDYFYTHSLKAAQQTLLRFQIELALEHDLPLVFHVREAFDDFWPIFDSYKGIKGVLHSFTDSVENMERAVAAGLYIGVNGIATFAKNENQHTMYKRLPLQHLLLETDAPFLTPIPYRGKINEPKYVGVVAEFMAKRREVSLEDISRQTTVNAKKLFSI